MNPSHETPLTVTGAREGHLKNIDLRLPSGRLTVLTGRSGSGKSTLAHDVIFQECQRRHLEALGYQGYRKPKVDSVRPGMAAIRITQTESNRNPRSTVGTATDIYTELRMVYEKLAVRPCPACGESVSAADCREETEQSGSDFRVFMICNRCGYRMEKLTRSHFSSNTREGACRTCRGLGRAMTIRPEQVLHDSLAPEDGGVDYWEGPYAEFQSRSLYTALAHFGVPAAPGTPLGAYGKEQQTLLLHGTDSAETRGLFPSTAPPKTVAAGKFEGVYTTLWRRLADKGGDSARMSRYFADGVCPDCGGERLNPLSRSATVRDTRLPELAARPMDELEEWVSALGAELDGAARVQVESYLLDLSAKFRRLSAVGLGYLSPSRQTVTLSGGERQRLKLAAALASELTGFLYILDEPTIGLHPRDTEGLIAMLRKLRDLGNTVLVIEHDPAVMQAADYIVDLGPGSGRLGGEIVGCGSLEELQRQPGSATGTWLGSPVPAKGPGRPGTGAFIEVSVAHLHNLSRVDAAFPIGCLTAVTGVSGSGKSSLVFGALAPWAAQPTAAPAGISVTGADGFDRVVLIEQGGIASMRRSNVATYSGLYDEIRVLFARLPEARERGLTASHFSFNAKGGRCERCEGLGVVASNLLFFEDVETVCPECGGERFEGRVLDVTYQGRSVKDVLDLSVREALGLFGDRPKMRRILELLEEVGLGYLELGQTLTTLSGGEGQRLKLARELLGARPGKRTLYLMDEPTTGLHPVDVEEFLRLLDRLVDGGSTVIVVEHNRQLIEAADWILDLGPGGGRSGGRIVFAGTPEQLLERGESATAECLRAAER